MSLYEPSISEHYTSQASVIDRRRFGKTSSTLYRNAGKRIFDTCAVVLAAPFWIPLMAVFAILVWITGGSPFYQQARVGMGGKMFRIWKLRTMVHDADAKLEAHLAADPAARLEWDVTQKLKNDPRITRIGAVLRKTSMDELPQLWNVLRGDMSLVGPRPMLPEQRALYPGTAYYALRPGITGSWQVSARNDTSFSDRAVFDTSYHDTVALSTDLSILAATITVVANPTGY